MSKIYKHYSEEVNQLKNRIRDLEKALTYYDFVIYDLCD